MGRPHARARERSSLREGLVLDQGRETIGTSALDGEPESILKMPTDSIAPFVCTLMITLLFSGMLLKSWWVAGCSSLAILVILIVWLWPREALLQTAR